MGLARNSAQILNVLYDMALASGGETRVRPLVTKMLQRLLYHTAFSCGLFVTKLPEQQVDEGMCAVQLEMAIGCRQLLPLVGTTLSLPVALAKGPSALIEQPELLNTVPQDSFKCRTILRLRVSEHELFLLLSPGPVDQSLPITSLFDTVLRNFAKNLQICRENESYTDSLREENQRRQAVETILRQERDLFVAGPVVVFRWAGGNDWRILYVSENVREQFGYQAQNLVEHEVPFLELVHPDDRKHVSELTEKRSSTGRGFFEAEYRIADAEGRWRWIYDLTFPEKDAEGRVQLLNGYIIDITLRKRAELEQRLLASAFDAKEAIVITDKNNFIVRVNQAFTDITGYAEEEVIGYRPDILRSGRYDGAFYRTMWHQILTQGHWEGEIINRRKDGELYPQWLSITAVQDDEGQICNYIAHFTDISAIKEQQHRIELAAAQEQALSGLLRLALAESEIDQFLSAFLELLLKDIPWLSLLPKGAVFLVDESEPRMLNMVATHGLAKELIERCQRVPFGTCYCGSAAQQRNVITSSHVDEHHEVSIEGMTDHGHYSLPIMQEQQLLGVLNIYLPPGHTEVPEERDYLLRVVDVLSLGISKRHSQQQVFAAKESAEKANRAKSEFLSSMSHELRTPLNAILGFAQILEYDERLDGEQQDNIHEILKAGHHLLELINEVLDLAKIEAGRIDLSIEQVEVEELVRECIQLVHPLAAARGIALQHETPGGLSVCADRVRLKQVLLNLLSNAIKYNCERGTVTILAVPDGEERLRLLVRDTGQGIAAEHLDELFLPFNRLDAEKSQVEGTGIGLTISRRLIELMEGTIGVESRPGDGSTFWVELPLRSSTVAVAQGGANQLSFSKDGSGLRKVLYVEDNPVNVKLVSQLLARLPYVDLLTAHTPELGIELALAHRPDLILLDINMPGMDGYQMLSVLKGDEQISSIPVLAVTANAMPRDVERARSAGFSEYFTKPLDARNFISAMERWLTA